MSNPTTSTPALGGDPPSEFEFLPEAGNGDEVARRRETPPRAAAAPIDAPDAGAAPVKKRGPLFRLAIILIAIAAVLWGGNFIHRMLVFEETEDAYIDGHIHEVSSRIAGSVTEVLTRLCGN